MTLKKRSKFFQGIEVTIITLLISFIGYYIDVTDPLLVHHDFSFLILWLAIVTLFYGLAIGLLMWIIFGIFASFTYINDPIFSTILLENLFFVFLFGLFFSNLHQEIDKVRIRNKYLKLRLKELSSAFFTLKISHDKLESIYITQPASFRFVISELLESCEHNTPELSAKNTLKVLKKFFSVNDATIWRVKNGVLTHPFYTMGYTGTTINTDDKLIQEVLTYHRPVYLKDLEDKEQSRYLYAVPFLDKRDFIVAILIIKEIPFLHYHEDNLMKINVVFNYIWTEYKKRASLDEISKDKKYKDIYKEHHEQQKLVDFKLEIIRLNNILNDFKIDSRVYIISTRNSYLNQEISDFLYQNNKLEVLDQYVSVRCGENYIHYILFPFLSTSSLFEVASNLDQALDELENNLKINILEEDLEYSLTPESHKKMRTRHVSVHTFNYLLRENYCVE